MTVQITCGNCGYVAPWGQFAFRDRKDHRESLVGFKIGCPKCRHSTYIGKKPCPSCSRMVGHSRNCQGQEIIDGLNGDRCKGCGHRGGHFDGCPRANGGRSVAEIFGID